MSKMYVRTKTNDDQLKVNLGQYYACLIQLDNILYVRDDNMTKFRTCIHLVESRFFFPVCKATYFGIILSEPVSGPLL